MIDLTSKPWWNYAPDDVRNLLKTSITLCEKIDSWDEKFSDYSFVVFPAAKGYEGFLKKMFLDLGFISKVEYEGKRFRIGRALNPELEKELRHESIYDRISNYCQGEELPKFLWETWKTCRNGVFHWFPGDKDNISLIDAKSKVDMIIEAIDFSVRECKIG